MSLEFPAQRTAPDSDHMGGLVECMTRPIAQRASGLMLDRSLDSTPAERRGLDACKLQGPSPSLVISCIALFVALGGVGYAAATGSIDGREIKNNSVAGRDIKNNSIAGRDVRTSGLTGSDVRAKPLTGADINEAGLGKVPSASQADSATTANTASSANTANSAGSVGGFTLRKVDYRGTNVTPIEIFNAGGLQISAACVADDLSLTARTTKEDSSIYSSFDDLEAAADPAGNDFEDRGFDTTETFDLLPGGGAASGGADDPALVHFQFDALDGTVATGILAADELNSGADDCRVSGTVTFG